jgi:RNA polymerase sigma-70 factor (ECF subfamily)
MAEASSTQLQELIDRLNAGDPSARRDLINHSYERLRRLTRKMLQDYARLRRWEDTDDVFQNAAVRLFLALRAVTVPSVQEFFGLAAAQIRRVLIDLARHYHGPAGPAIRRAAVVIDESSGNAMPGCDPCDSTFDPGRLALWTEFHKQVEALPAREREVFGLLWYHGMTQPEAATVLNVSEATLKRWWLSARLTLQERLRGEMPAP